jgi:hypothetical protein
MSLANIRDTRNRLSAGRNRKQHTFRPAVEAERANSSEIAPDEARADRLSFAEDFMLEHTHSGLLITMMGMKGGSGTARREQQKSAQCYGFPS